MRITTETLNTRFATMERVQDIINRGDVTMARTLIMVSAATAMADYKQYADHFDINADWQERQWRVVRVNRDIEAKGGTQFLEGDFALVTSFESVVPQFKDCVSAWSVRNCGLVIINQSSISEI